MVDAGDSGRESGMSLFGDSVFGDAEDARPPPQRLQNFHSVRSLGSDRRPNTVFASGPINSEWTNSSQLDEVLLRDADVEVDPLLPRGGRDDDGLGFPVEPDDDDDAVRVHPRKHRNLERLWFFLCGVGMLIVKNCILALMPYFVAFHGDMAQPAMLASYNAAQLVVLICQVVFDARLNVFFGHYRSYMVRGVTSFTGLVVTAILYSQEAVDSKLIPVLIASVLLGSMLAAAFGTVSQLASHFPPNCTPMIMFGEGLSSIFLLLVTWPLGLIGAAATAESWQLYSIFALATFLIAVAFASFLKLLNGSTFRMDVARLRRLNASRSQRLLRDDFANEDGESIQMSAARLAWHIRLPLLSVFVNMITTVFCNLNLSVVPSSGMLGIELVQYLNYSNFISDFIGRLLVFSDRLNFLHTNRQVFLAVMLRCVGTGVYIWYAWFSPQSFRNDIAAIIFIALYSAVGGYTNTQIFTVFQEEEQVHLSSDERARGITFINGVLQFGAVCALPFPFIINGGVPTS